MGRRYSRKALASYIASTDTPKADLAMEVAAFLMDLGSISDLDSLMRDVIEIRGREDGVVELTARSAHSLTSEIKTEVEAIAKRLYPGAREVIIHEINDPSVIGGTRLQFANASLDLTIKAKLNKLREAVA